MRTNDKQHTAGIQKMKAGEGRSWLVSAAQAAQEADFPFPGVTEAGGHSCPQETLVKLKERCSLSSKGLAALK